MPDRRELVKEIRAYQLSRSQCVLCASILLEHASRETVTASLESLRNWSLNYRRDDAVNAAGDGRQVVIDVRVDDGNDAELIDPRLLPACVDVMEAAAASTPRSLQHFARLRVWKAIGRDVNKVEALPIPQQLITCMFQPEFYGL